MLKTAGGDWVGLLRLSITVQRYSSYVYSFPIREIVKLSSRDDKIVNSAIARALRDWNNDPDISIVTEVSLNDRGTLVADTAWITPTDIYCLEFKWRSSVLNASEIIRETAGRVRECAQELPELKSLLGLL